MSLSCTLVLAGGDAGQIFGKYLPVLQHATKFKWLSCQGSST